MLSFSLSLSCFSFLSYLLCLRDDVLGSERRGETGDGRTTDMKIKKKERKKRRNVEEEDRSVSLSLRYLQKSLMVFCLFFFFVFFILVLSSSSGNIAVNGNAQSSVFIDFFLIFSYSYLKLLFFSKQLFSLSLFSVEETSDLLIYNTMVYPYLYGNGTVTGNSTCDHFGEIRCLSDNRSISDLYGWNMQL